jgi:6-phosphofructokinase 1
LGGAAAILGEIVEEQFKCKVRSIEFSLMQRCAAHIGSRTDIEEAFLAGQQAVKAAVEGHTDYMIGFERTNVKGKYGIKTVLIPLAKVANAEKTVPLEWFNQEKNFLKKDFIDYALPLIQGDSGLPFEEGLPKFAKLKKVSARK